MPPKTAKAVATGDAADGRKQPTAQEAFVFYAIIKNMKGKPDIDWSGVAADAGFKNAETAKVRYGQIKRKLGMDTWVPNKSKDAKDEDAGDTGAPQTPASSRTKKAAATPSTAGTGAGVKKRANTSKRSTNATPGSRSRKAKSQALIKMEEQGQDEADKDQEDEEMMDISTPTRTNTELGSASSTTYTAPEEYADFPAVLPETVLERQAILVNLNGTWTLSPVPIDVHAQWLARLPANLQTRFYTQATAASKGTTSGSNRAKKSTSTKNSTPINNGFLMDDEEEEEDVDAVNNHLFGEHFANATAMPMGMSMSMPMDMSTAVELGYLPASAAAAAGGVGGAGRGAEGGPLDLHSIPMHPGFMAQMEREQEERDSATLFGGAGQGGF